MARVRERTGADDSLEDLVHLARSRHRVELLRHLSVEARTRRDLEESTDMSQPTLSRILGDFERRRWVSNQHDGAYALTSLGAVLAGAVEDLLSALDANNRLEEVADDLPLDRLGFDLGHLASATVTTPSEADPLAHMRRFDELAAEAETVRMFSNVLACSPATVDADAHREFLAVVDEIVVTETAVAGLEDTALRDWLGDRIDAGELDLYRYDGSATFLLGCFDEVVGIVPIDDAGVPTGLIEASAPPIREWAQGAFDDLRVEATRVSPADLPA